MAYLDEHRPARSQFRKPRRQPLSGIVVLHTAENAPDHVAFDGGAEAVARFIQGRSDAGSYHDLVDSDSAIDLVDYDCEAFHDATGSNPHSLGLSVATRADAWPWAPQAWRDGAVEQAAQRAARMARHVKARTGIVIPPKRITRAESDRRIPGFISHAERDPTRRTDPGRDFPWGIFLSRYAALTGDLPAPATTEESDMAYGTVYRLVDDGSIAFAAPNIWQPTNNPDQADFFHDTAGQEAAIDCNAVQWAWAQALALSGGVATSVDLDRLAEKIDGLGDQASPQDITAAVKRALREGTG